MSDVGKLREDEAELGEEAEHLTGDALDVVLTADDDEAGDLVADQHLVADRDGVLHAVQPFGHFEIERRRAPQRIGVATMMASAQCTSAS